MPLDLTDEETAVLARELSDITWSDRHPLSPRIKNAGGHSQEAPTATVPDQQPRRSRGSMSRRAGAGIGGAGRIAVYIGSGGLVYGGGRLLMRSFIWSENSHSNTAPFL